MNITQENTGNLTARVKIEIYENDYSEKVTKALKNYQKQAVIPGFRKGTASVQLINKLYGKSVLIDEVQEILSESMSKYLTDNKIDLLGRPIPDDEKTGEIDWGIQKDFAFYFDIAIYPEFSIDLSGLKLTYFQIEPDEAAIDEYLKNITQRFGNVEPIQTYTEKDPSILFYGEFQELNEDGSPNENGIKASTYLNIEKIESEDIQNLFMGKSANDSVDFEYRKAFNNVADISAMLKISKEQAETFNGTVRFTISEISKLIPHVLNEELYKKVFPNKEITTEKEFRDELAHDISLTYSREADHKLLDDAIKGIVENTKMELPEDFLKRWLLHLNEASLNEEQIEGQWDTYVSSMKWELIEGKLSKEYNILITEEEEIDFVINNYLRGYFPGADGNDEEQQKKMAEIAKSVLENKERKTQVTNSLLNNKYILLFKEKAKLTNKKVFFDEFLKAMK